MNNDLINRSALISAIEKGEGISWERYGDNEVCVRKKYIDNAPTVEEKSYAMGYQDGLEDGLDDIRPKGKWIYLDKDEPMKVECPFCHERKCCISNYCDYCGAKMDMGGEKDGK